VGIEQNGPSNVAGTRKVNILKLKLV